MWIDPIAFEIGNLEVRWYGILIVTGVLLALFMGLREGKKIGIDEDFIYTGLIICLPLAMIGARIWYVLFNLGSFDSFAEVIGLKGGFSGLAIQGGVIVAIIFVLIYCHKKKVSPYRLFDILAPGLLIGQIVGRWGNFCNHELYGQMIEDVALFQKILPDFITNNMYISGGYLLPGLTAGYYHPMFLYESSLNFVGLIIILILRRKSKRLESGDFLGFYLIWYGIVRTITESFRHEGEVLLLGNIRISVVMSIVFIIGGILFLIFKRLKGQRVLYQDLIIPDQEKKATKK
ncbi:MAG: prolipoprotein diacylglyceryl transferase [Bacilli bacterium]|jgi:phosphatidylglycerol:prolipoprotein diacylglycerol transferase|nr:prolipoprotein diacylglyceryl transferase [Bacilli bacterium]MDD3348225.1 prolipoprotein diacylglyceryl transferase [Bacilli bacterium]MDD4056477.1 prolipoprotein diacylglyceryl transferase [Bacilli bacterium]MDY0208953.1 prolipoprotein diacylglyceryl transferase [Bacilli bacterium]